MKLLYPLPGWRRAHSALRHFSQACYVPTRKSGNVRVSETPSVAGGRRHTHTSRTRPRPGMPRANRGGEGLHLPNGGNPPRCAELRAIARPLRG